MNETTNPTSLIAREYRKRMELTYRSFAEALTEHLVNTGISHTSIANWEKGINDPSTDFLLTCLVVHQDWRRQFAIDCLQAKLPEVFARAASSIRILI
jgi:transcriptional regulator with XRE-family HTH domain